MLGRMIRTALNSLLHNRLRTALTVLGIGIGIAAVVCTAALGAASSERVQTQIDALGEDFLWIRAGSRNMSGVRTGVGGVRTLTPADAAAIEAAVPDIAMCSPQMSAREQIVSGGRNWNTRYQGVLPSFFAIRRRTLSVGTFFTDADVAAGARVMVLGPSVAARLFDGNPVGQMVRMGRFPFRVVGVVTPGGATRGGLDRDDTLFVPITTAMRNLDRRTWVTDVMCAVTSPDRMAGAEAQIVSLLRERHRLDPDEPNDFQIQRPIESLQLRAETARTMRLLLTAIGAVSLVVGGVGIMNIMLVAVTERRREIGVRLAVGARVRHIRWQFLAEASAIGVVGGLLGVALGWVGARVLSYGFDWPTVVSVDAVMLGAASAIGAGLIFGYYPAHRASRLEPIDAIRTEQ